MPDPDKTRKLLAALEASQRGGGIPLQQLLSANPNTPRPDPGIPSWDVVPAQTPGPPPAPRDPRIGGMSPALSSIARLLTSQGGGAPARAAPPQPQGPPPRWLPAPPSDLDLLMQALSGKAPPPVQPIGTPPGLSQKAMQMPRQQMTTPVPRDKPRGQWEF